MKRTRYARRVVFVVTVTTVVAVCLWLLVERHQEDRLNTLFTGEEILSPPPPVGFTSMVEYATVDAAVTPPRNVTEVSGDAWHDAETGASRVARVTAPSTYRERLRPEFLTVTYPPEKAVFPPNLCAPFFEWSDEHNNLWQVTLRIPERSLAWTQLSHTRRWRVPEAVWHTIVERAGDLDVTLAVKGIQCAGVWGKTRDTVHVSQTVRFRIARDPCDNAVVYRLVDPPFYNRKTPDTFVRDVRRLKPRRWAKL